MSWSRRFGWVSPRERAAADEFFAALVGSPRPRPPGRTIAARHLVAPAWSPRASRSESLDESHAGHGEAIGPSVRTLPLSHYEQWVANVAGASGAERPAPLGPAWVRARLLGPTKPSELTVAATELQQLDGQRASRTGTDYRVDTAQTELFRLAVERLLPIVERLDTSEASRARCQHVFATTGDLATRKAHWRTRIDALAASDRPALLDWIVGKLRFSSNATVQAATDEAAAQIGCLRRAINRDRGSMADPLARSPTRTFDDQLCIWAWKFFFRADRSGLSPICSGGATGPFGSMTETAVSLCHAAMPSARRHFRAGMEWSPAGSGAVTVAHRTAWTTHLDADQRSREILQTSSAPGISRHHWGTDVDFASVTAADWNDASHRALYEWLRTHAITFGLVQVYTPDRPGYTANTPLTGYDGYIEEKWHWSYYPVAQALLEWAQEAGNRPLVLARLQSAWGDVRTSTTYESARRTLGWTSSTDPFAYIERRWESYVFNVNRYVTPP